MWLTSLGALPAPQTLDHHYSNNTASLAAVHSSSTLCIAHQTEYKQFSMVQLALPAVDLGDRRTQLYAAGAATAVLGGALLAKRALRQKKPFKGPYTPDTLPADAFDVIIVGAGAVGHTGGRGDLGAETVMCVVCLA